MSKKRPKQNVAKKKKFTSTRELSRDDGGYDWGWPALALVSANTELATRLRAGGFGGCGYGLMSQDGPPFMSLLGVNFAGMKSALSLIREWTNAVGPNAVNLEILFDGAGYGLTISQDPQLLRWRVAGLDTTDRSLVLAMSLTKRMDSRHPFLDDLAKYSRQPIAPVYLTVAGVAASKRPTPGALQPWMEGAIKLPGISVYKRPEDRLPGSMAMLESELADRSKWGTPPPPAEDIATVTHERERRLNATFPRVMHTLRHRGHGNEFLRSALQQGCSKWQIEQAVCNLILEGEISAELKDAKRFDELGKLRRDYSENFIKPADFRAFKATDIFEQIFLDTGYLLRRIDARVEAPDSLHARNARLRELGYV